MSGMALATGRVHRNAQDQDDGTVRHSTRFQPTGQQRQSARSVPCLPDPFHVYSMRQAIDEGFILDVLRNYIP